MTLRIVLLTLLVLFAHRSFAAETAQHLSMKNSKPRLSTSTAR